MKGLLSSAVATLAAVTAVGAQNVTVPLSLSAAATTVSASATLFPAETNSTVSNMFGFASNTTNSTLSKRSLHFCKLMPGDFFWPSDIIWYIFDLLLGNRLVKTTPLAAVCYPDWPEYDADQCATIKSEWYSSDLHMNDPASIMLPLYEGRTCMPTGDNYTSTCEIGGYPTYVVNASNVAQIQLAVNFARNLNLRLVVKNTGHDFNGKAAGKGALSIWTHWLKDKAFYPTYHADNGYVGPAMKVGSGVQVWEAYEFAKANGMSVVGGEAVTVGLGGGYTAGGGHSPLSSMYGMAADQVLAMEVVMADGRFITATSTQHSDIFWMLRGGGGSTIGVVTSLTIRAYPQLPTTTVTFNFTINDCPNADAFWAGVEAYIDNMEPFVDAGTYGYYYLGASAYEIGTDYNGSTEYYFRMESFVAPNMTIAETETLLAPWFEVLDSNNITYTPWYNHADNFYDVWVSAFPQEYVGTALVKTASRLMPRSVFQNDTLRQSTYAAHKDAIENGLFIAGFHVTGTGKAVTPPTDTSVLPAWRDTLAHVIVGIEWETDASWETVHNSSLYVTSWMDVLRDIAPDSGAYMSEADLLEPNLQEAFYGSNYAKLYAMKQMYDPTGLFFALTAVGAEDWEVQVTDPLPYSWNNNGRLCPVSS
ncbi:FAD binding domain protein [Aspergillus ochraceoroseus]|uniref:FAD binding domain protein n=1 Tax=Aspergillus ochraceoroseus TaxID=138278 RepID=A0A0F8URT7_9EURO|nr:FAD binding domain protein [Aspergillus ochraceoroseus]